MAEHPGKMNINELKQFAKDNKWALVAEGTGKDRAVYEKGQPVKQFNYIKYVSPTGVAVWAVWYKDGIIFDLWNSGDEGPGVKYHSHFLQDVEV